MVAAETAARTENGVMKQHPGTGPHRYSTCLHCRQEVRQTGAEWYTTRSGELCTPGLRGAPCRLAYYLPMFGIDPMRLADHDALCDCRRTLTHAPRWEHP